MRLLSAELRRTLARRFLRLTLIAGIAIVVVASVGIGIRSSRPSASDLQAAHVARQAQVNACVTDAKSLPGAEASCEQRTIPEEYFLDPNIKPFDRASILEAVPWAVMVLALVGWLIGIVLVGGEWEARTIAWQLTL